MFDQIKEECGVFGIYSKDTMDVASQTYFALYASTTLCLLVADNVIGKQSLLTDTIPIFNCGMLLIISDILLLIYCFPLIRSMLRLFRHPHGL